MLLENYRVLVTGASRGIGRAIALEFAREGAYVVANARNDMAGLQSLVDEMGAGDAVLADVGTERGRLAIAGHIVERGVDVLVNNAGVLSRSNFLQVKVDEWDRVMNVNLAAPFFLAQMCAPGMIEREDGVIVNIGSIAGMKNKRERGIEYGMSKAALHYMTGSLARALAPHVRVNCIAPGYVATDMLSSPARVAEATQETPSRRLTTPMEIARLAVYLCSNAARNITGAVIPIDGGIHRT